MELNVLPRGDVTETTRVALAHFSEREQLLSRQNALRDLHAEHLGILGLALSVGAAYEAIGAPCVGRDFATLELVEGRDELVNLRLACKRQARAPESFGIVNGCHSDLVSFDALVWRRAFGTDRCRLPPIARRLLQRRSSLHPRARRQYALSRCLRASPATRSALASMRPGQVPTAWSGPNRALSARGPARRAGQRPSG